MRSFTIDPDITRASTLPSWVYSSPEIFDAQRERIFARSSRIYSRGRYSPRRETGIHHFHGLLAEALR